MKALLAARLLYKRLGIRNYEAAMLSMARPSACCVGGLAIAFVSCLRTTSLRDEGADPRSGWSAYQTSGESWG